jgi:hypothetical protein
MTMGALSEVMVEEGRKARRGLRGGGSGMGALACFVCSYLKAMRPVSSLKGLIRVVGPPLDRKLLDLWGVMA